MVIKKLPAIFFILTCSLFAQSFEFYKEKIEVRLNSTSCTVTGDYYFKNNNPTGIESTIFYPFIVNDSLPFPESITIESDGKQIKYLKKKDGLLFHIKLSAKDSLKLVINYSQPAPFRVMEYILTSTKYWGKPFEEAEYLISIPQELEVLSTSLDFNKIFSENGRTYWYLNTINYMPQTNFVIVWRENENN